MKYIIAICFCAVFASCELNPPPPDCIVSIEFENLKADSEAYNSEVMLLLERTVPSDYRYFFNTFLTEKEESYMIVNFRNEKSCFDVKIFVDKWDKLAGMLRVNGKAYPKELVNLEWTIELVDDKKTVVYQDMNTIID